MQSLKQYIYATLNADDETEAFYAPRHTEFGFQWPDGLVLPHQRVVFGTPITPEAMLKQLAGASFCVSFAAPAQLELCMQLLSPESMLLIDNGAYSYLNRGHGKINRERFWRFANYIQRCCPLAVAVIPDVINGNEADNWLEASYALRHEFSEFPSRTMFTWHMNESIQRLRDAARLFNFIGIGSCAEYDVQKFPRAYLERLKQAYLTISYVEARWGHRPHVHLMRGISMLPYACWCDSADSTNVARNHNRRKGEPQHVANMAFETIKKVNRRHPQLWPHLRDPNPQYQRDSDRQLDLF